MPNPDRTPTLAALDKIVPPLPDEALAYFKYWTPQGYQPHLLSDWELLVLRLLWNGVGTKTASSPKEYNPEITRVSGLGELPTTQSFTVSNVGQNNGTITTNGKTTVIKPGETPSWAAPVENYLSAIQYDATGTEFVITYLENLAN